MSPGPDGSARPYGGNAFTRPPYRVGVPEGHLLHHHARRQREGLLGATTISSPQGRFDAAAVDGQLTSVDVHGKHLFHEWSSGAIVHIHLGKRGLFLEGPPPADPARPQVRMRVVGPRLVSDLIAPLVCEIVDAAGREAQFASLGVDPLHPDADRSAALTAISSTGSAIGAALLDQSRISGVGNALRADVLNLVGLHPRVPADAIDEQDLDRLWDTLVEVMERSARTGSIDHTVYRRERCARCGTAVVTEEVGGRTTYICPFHQPEPA